MKFEIFKFESVTSTNDVAIDLIREEKKELGCIYAAKQTKGRGAHGKKWVSEMGNLLERKSVLVVKNYLSEHYGISDRELIGKVTPGDFPYLSFDNNQNVTLFDDPSIHAQFNVKEHYAAVTDPLGHLHTFYKAYEVVPKFADTISKVTTNVKTVKP